jgi:hypothetical protein
MTLMKSLTTLSMLVVVDGVVVGAAMLITQGEEVVAAGFYETADAGERMEAAKMRRESIETTGYEVVDQAA